MIFFYGINNCRDATRRDETTQQKMPRTIHLRVGALQLFG